eukprot:1137607-Pelagomonas_calceolata.AAC.4
MAYTTSLTGDELWPMELGDLLGPVLLTLGALAAKPIMDLAPIPCCGLCSLTVVKKEGRNIDLILQAQIGTTPNLVICSPLLRSGAY